MCFFWGERGLSRFLELRLLFTLLRFYALNEKKFKDVFACKVGPLPVITRVITPLIRLITPVTHI